jgi:pimeloyl-ACP methyl ester carboxylesterase
VPHFEANGVELYYEDTGSGPPVIFSHEFAADYRGWEPQVRALGRSYRCITYSHRGFPPSGIPEQSGAYTRDLLIEDLLALVRHLSLESAHFVGFSMGGNVVLNFALRYPKLCQSIVVVGTGSGSSDPELFERDIERTVDLIRTRGIEGFAAVYAEGPTRQPFKRKDPFGWEVFRRQLAEHSPIGQAEIMLGVLHGRPSIFSLEGGLRALDVPALIVIGDEDEPCIEPAIFMKRHIPSAGLVVLPQSGHAVNLEEPALFNAAVLEFLRLVEAGRWARRSGISASLLPAAEQTNT